MTISTKTRQSYGAVQPKLLQSTRSSLSHIFPTTANATFIISEEIEFAYDLRSKYSN